MLRVVVVRCRSYRSEVGRLDIMSYVLSSLSLEKLKELLDGWVMPMSYDDIRTVPAP